MKYNKWLEEEIELLIKKAAKVGDNQLSLLLPRHTKGSIQSMRRKMGIKKIGRIGSRKLSDISFDTLNDIEQQIFIGSLLGDGYVIKNKRLINCSFGETHGKKQGDYLKWKHHMLSPFKPSITKNNRSMSTPTHEFFSTLRTQMYTDSKKTKLPKLISTINELGLLVWYLDDGGIHKGQANIWNSCFDRIELAQSINSINENLNLSLSVKTNRISLRKSNRDKLFPIWEQMFLDLQIPSVMRYKLRHMQ